MNFSIEFQSRHVATVQLKAKAASVNYPEHLQACSDRDKAARTWADHYGASLDITHVGVKVRFEFISHDDDKLAAQYAAEDFVRWLEDHGKWEPAE